MNANTEFEFTIIDKPQNKTRNEAPPCQYSDGFCEPYFQTSSTEPKLGIYISFLRKGLKNTFPAKPADCQSCVAEVETSFTDEKTARPAIKELLRLVDASRPSESLPPHPQSPLSK